MKFIKYLDMPHLDKLLVRVDEAVQNSHQILQNKGIRFESICKTFLENDVQYNSIFKKIEKTKPGAMGIDLIATEHNGAKTGIQCKHVESLTAKQLDIFFGHSPDYDNLLLMTTANNLSEPLLKLLIKNKIQIIQSMTLDRINWNNYPKIKHKITKPRKLNRFQKLAHDDVVEGFKKNNRGKLIMACGTGKTFTSLKIAESMYPTGIILYLVPSIQLIKQTMYEWALHKSIKQKQIGVCSDSQAGITHDDDVGTYVIDGKPTTDITKICKQLDQKHDGMTVVFCTYQSINIIKNIKFDLTISDEAHRTASLLNKKDPSPFLQVHFDPNDGPKYITTKKRLYMTATRKIFHEHDKVRARGKDLQALSMDDSLFGTDFHNLAFKKAVENGLLLDYRVIVLGIREDKYADNTIIENKSIYAAMYDALNDPSNIQYITGLGFEDNPDKVINDISSLQHGIAFCGNIKQSKAFAEDFAAVARQLKNKNGITINTKHVDGKMNAQIRHESLQWLENNNLRTCNILSNARCLGEGVDVPALDCVIFNSPKQSEVDVVQCVGRVMRKPYGTKPGKSGYVIVPIIIPKKEDVTPQDILKGGRYKTVLDVLRALSSHDSEFNIVGKVLFALPPPTSDPPIVDPNPHKLCEHGAISNSCTICNSIILKQDLAPIMIKSISGAHIWRDFGRRAAESASQLRADIVPYQNKPEFITYVNALKKVINNSVDKNDATKLLVQHILTKTIFDRLFRGHSDAISVNLEMIVSKLEEYGLKSHLEKFNEEYKIISRDIDNLKSDKIRQEMIRTLYNEFFAIAFPDDAKELGVVYTPVQIVDFMLKSVNDILKKSFNKNLSDDGITILDPFTGMGTFITRLLNDDMNLLIKKNKYKKYKNEIIACEKMLTAYRIASVNTALSYNNIQFDGLIFTDTFGIHYMQKNIDSNYFHANDNRRNNLNQQKIKVIISNPPYGTKKKKHVHDHMKKRISDTYRKENGDNKKDTLNDSYVHAFRWASDFLDDDYGVIAYVSNGSWLKSPAARGIRRSFSKEFDMIYVYDLRGHATIGSGDVRRKEGDGVFGEGTKLPITITFLIKINKSNKTKIYYKDIGDYLSKNKKLQQLEKEISLDNVTWNEVTQDEYGDWLDHRKPFPKTFVSLDDIFELQTFGILTGSDLNKYGDSLEDAKIKAKKFINYIDETKIRKVLHRHNKIKWVCCDKTMLDRIGDFYNVFPKPNSKNKLIVFTGIGAQKFMVGKTDIIIDYQYYRNTKYYPLYSYESGYRSSNLKESIKPKFGSMPDEEIFDYVYDVLSSKKYQQEWGKTCTKETPKIPVPKPYATLYANL